MHKAVKVISRFDMPDLPYKEYPSDKASLANPEVNIKNNAQGSSGFCFGNFVGPNNAQYITYCNHDDSQ